MRRFRDREEVTLISFASKVKSTKTHSVPTGAGAQELASINGDVQALSSDGGTAVYSSLQEAYRVIQRQQSAAGDDRFTSIVLMTDGESNEGASDKDFRTFYGGCPRRRRRRRCSRSCSVMPRRSSCRGSPT